MSLVWVLSAKDTCRTGLLGVMRDARIFDDRVLSLSEVSMVVREELLVDFFPDAPNASACHTDDLKEARSRGAKNSSRDWSMGSDDGDEEDNDGALKGK